MRNRVCNKSAENVHNQGFRGREHLYIKYLRKYIKTYLEEILLSDRRRDKERIMGWKYETNFTQRRSVTDPRKYIREREREEREE